jgi:hypothetical protein
MNQKGIASLIIVVIVIVTTVAVVGGTYVVMRSGGGEPGSGFSNGTSQIITGGATNQLFDFSAGNIVTSDHDFGIEPWQNWYGVSGISPALQGYNGMDNLVIDMGAVDYLDIVATAPETGYSADVYAQVGHVYFIKCREGTYGKIRITSITYTDGNYPATVVFEWEYQSNGSRVVFPPPP